MTMRLEPVEIPSPALDEAKKRLAELRGIFHFNEIVSMLDGLIEEADSMPLAERFSKQKRIFSSIYASDELIPGSAVNPMDRHTTEAEHKRRQIKRNLEGIKRKITMLDSDFAGIFLDMQAAKTD